MSFTAIDSQTLTGTAASMTFSTIPATFRDLVLVIQATSTVQFVGGRVRINSDSSNSYQFVQIRGTAPGVNSQAGVDNSARIAEAFTISEPRQVTIEIMDYSATDKHKVLFSRSGKPQTHSHAARYPQNTAVNELMIFLTSGNFTAGSTFSLYGIEA